MMAEAPKAPGALPSPKDLLPHRDPFLFVTAILTLEPGLKVEAYYDVPEDLPIFEGHFPGNPILPGVITVEALAQAGACALLADERFKGRLPLFGGIEKARFKRIVRPGERLELFVELIRLSSLGGRGRGTARVGAELAAEGELLFAFAR